MFILTNIYINMQMTMYIKVNISQLNQSKRKCILEIYIITHSPSLSLT